MKGSDPKKAAVELKRAPACAHCAYRSEKTASLRCCRYPPQSTGFVVVAPDDWCGEYEEEQ